MTSARKASRSDGATQGRNYWFSSKEQNVRRCFQWAESASRPRNSRVPERVSRMQKINGWSARNTGGGGGGFVSATLAGAATMVAAAASVPSSFASTHALWNTSEMKRFCVPSMPEKLAFGPKARSEERRVG